MDWQQQSSYTLFGKTGNCPALIFDSELVYSRSHENIQSQLNPSIKRELAKTLSQLVADIKSWEEADKFFHDFLNESEYDTFAKRLAVAYWLKKGRSYTNIKQNLKVSSATIASVQSMMEKPGMKLAIKNVEAEEWANQWAEKIKKFVKK